MSGDAIVNDGVILSAGHLTISGDEFIDAGSMYNAGIGIIDIESTNFTNGGLIDGVGYETFVQSKTFTTTSSSVIEAGVKIDLGAER